MGFSVFGRDPVLRGLPVGNGSIWSARRGCAARYVKCEVSTPEKQLAAVQAVARALDGAPGVAVAAPRVLEALCTELGFERAAWWRARPGEPLQLLVGWHHTGGDGNAARDQAWRSQQPSWTPDGTVAIPLVAGAVTHGVVELHTSNAEEPREGLLQTAATVGLMLGQFVDVTDQLHARQRVEQLANALPEVVWMATPEGESEFFNRRWYELTGVPLDRGGFEHACHPDDLEAVRTAWTQALAAGTPYELEVRLKRASDGTWRWHLVRGLPITDGAGKITRWVGSATDIDDHKRAEETSRLLAQASALLGSTLDYESTLQTIARLAVPKVADWCSVYLQDEGEPLPRQLVVAHSDPEKVKWARELQKVFPPDPDAQSGAIAVIRTGQPEFFPDIPDELLVKLAKNEEQLKMLRQIGFSSGMTVPLVAHGRTFGAITLVRAESRTRYTQRDFVAAQELANLAAAAIANAGLYRDAQRAIQMRDEFLSVASHELKTPLTPLQLHVQSLKKRAGSDDVPPRVASKLDAIGRQVNRMERLINSMLDVSLVSAEALELELREVDLAALAREVGERFKADIGREAVIAVDAPNAVRGWWDPVRVDQILTNLVSNAVKFGGGKPVHVSVRELPDGGARLEVTDHGIGIALEDQQRIFERFERAVAAMSYGGLGLGLWIARELVERMGGTIGVASTPGEGSKFTVELPQGHRVPAEPPRAKEAAP